MKRMLMKRMLLLLLCFLVLLSGCKREKEPEKITQEKESSQISVRTGTGWAEDWGSENDTVEKIDYCVVPDAEAAVNIATVIYQESPIHTYAPQSVFYDEEAEVWVVEFYYPIPESGPVATDQPVHAVAIRKADGQVLGVFRG